MLYDPRSNATPSQLEAWRARDERLQKMQPPPRVFVPEAPNPMEVWIGQQCELNPIPKPKEPWFQIIEEVNRPIPKVGEIQRAVAKFYDISLVELLAERRVAYLVRARQVGIYLSKKLTTKSLPEIGRRFGGRDHSTVHHSVRKIELLRQSDQKLESDIRALTLLLGASL